MNRCTSWMLAGAAAIGVGAALCGAADVVVLRSGTMMEGDILSMDDDEIVLKVEAGKTILDREDVRSIHLDTTIKEVEAGDWIDNDDDQDTDANDDDNANGHEAAADGPVFKPGDKKRFALGDAVEVGGVRLRLVQAKVGAVTIVDLFGGTKDSREDYLQFWYRVDNIDDKDELELRGDPAFGEPYVTLEDQDGKEIDEKSFGMGTSVEGAMKDGDELDPGEGREHVEVFRKPRGSAERLTLRVDLKKYGQTGVVKWEIDVFDVE